MMDKKNEKQMDFWRKEIANRDAKTTKTSKQAGLLPEKLGKSIKLSVPDFSAGTRAKLQMQIAN